MFDLLSLLSWVLTQACGDDRVTWLSLADLGRMLLQ